MNANKKPNCSLWSLSLLGLLFTAIACDREIALNIKDYVPKIVMNGIISPDSLIEISLSKSFLYTDTMPGKGLLNRASVSLYINGERRESMRFVRVDTAFINKQGDSKTALTSVYRSTVFPKVGDLVRVEASAEGLQTVWGETTVPLPPTISGVDTSFYFTAKPIIQRDEKSSTEKDSLFQNMRVKMGISIPADNQKYGLKLQARLMTEELKEYPELQGRYLYLFTDDDPVFEESHHTNILEEFAADGVEEKNRKHGTSAIFTGKLFRDNSYTLDFSVTDFRIIYTKTDQTENYYEWEIDIEKENSEVLNPPIELLISSVSPELYSFLLFSRFDPESDEAAIKIISEPEITYSNVHNGIGVIGSISPAKARINMQTQFPKRE